MASKKAAAKKTFYLQARVHVYVAMEIEANSLDEALAFSKDLKQSDFLQATAEATIEDWEMKISGVYSAYKSLSP